MRGNANTATKAGAKIMSYRRSLSQAWGESEALQPRRVWQSSPTRRSLCQAWGESEALQPRRVQQSSRTRRSLSQAWGEETKAESVTSMG